MLLRWPRSSCGVSSTTCHRQLITKYGIGGASSTVTEKLSHRVYAAIASPVAAPQATPARTPCRPAAERPVATTTIPATTTSAPAAASQPGRSPSTRIATAMLSTGPAPRATG